MNDRLREQRCKRLARRYTYGQLMQMANDSYKIEIVKDIVHAMTIKREQTLARLYERSNQAETIEEFARNLVDHVSYEELREALRMDEGGSEPALRAVRRAIEMHENRILEGSWAVSDAFEVKGETVGPPADQLATSDGWDL